MICRVEYGPKYYVIINLIDTPAVRKWVYALNENKQYNYKLYGRPLSSYYKLQKDPKLQQELVDKINFHIHELNKYVCGEPFPYEAYVGMDFVHSQRIHRAFTTAAVTHGSWIHNIDNDLLREIKFMDSEARKKAMEKWAKKSFHYTDFEKFDFHAEMINWQIHNYEHYIPTEKSEELKISNCDCDCLYNQIDNKSIVGDIDKNRPSVGVQLTMDELSKSFIGNYMDYDVFIHSSIFGKSYLETFVEYDDANEFDVVNVETILGDFFMVGGDPMNRKRFFSNSSWSRWVGELLLPIYITHPVPLGTVVEKHLPEELPELHGQYSTNISFRWN